MEKVVAIKLEVDNGDSISEVEKLEKATKSYDRQLQEINKSTLELKEINNEFKNELIKLEAQYKKMPKSQMAARKAVKIEIDNLKEAITDNNAALKDFVLDKQNVEYNKRELRLMKTEMNGIKASMAVGEGILAGYTAFQGVMAMVGVEGEDLIKTMVKLQAAQSALVGGSKLLAMTKKQSNFILGAQTLALKALTAAQLVYATAVGTSTGALKIFRLAMLATGIGALVVGIGLLIANFESVSKWVKNVAGLIYNVLEPAIDFILAPLRMLGIIDEKVSKQAVEASKRRIKAIEDERKANEKRRADIDKTISKNRELTDETQKELQREIDLRKANGENVTGLENKKREQMLSSLKIERELSLEKLKLIEAEFKARMANGMLTFKQIMEQKKLFNEQLAIVKGVHVKLLDEYHAYEVKRVEQRKAARDEAAKWADNDIAILERNLDEVQVMMLAAQESMPLLMEVPELESERYFSGVLGRIAEFYDDWEHMDTESKLALAESALAYTSEVMGSIATITEAVNQSQMMEVQAIEASTKNKLKNEQLSALEKFNIEVASAEATDKINKKIFERNKKLQIAQATIDGASAVVKALASAPTPYNFVLAGAVGAASLAQLNMIRQQQYQSVAGQIQPPSFSSSIDDTDTDNQNQGQGFGGNQTIINNTSTVSVVEINDTQERLEDINNVAIIGG